MTWTLREIVAHILLSLRDPRRAATELLAWDIPDLAVGPLVVLSAIFQTLLLETFSAMFPPPPGAEVGYIAPLAVAFISIVQAFVAALAIAVIGRAFGGHGRFRASLIVNAWTQFVLMAFVVPFLIAALMASLLLPTTPFLLLVLGVLIYLVWVLVSFIAELHGFDGIGKPLAVYGLAFAVTLVVTSPLIALFGTTIMGEDARV